MFINLSLNNPRSKNIFNDLFSTQIERGVIPGEYNSYFCRYLGVGDEEKYNNNLAYLKEKSNYISKVINLPVSLNKDLILEENIDKNISSNGKDFYKYIGLFKDNTLNLRAYKTMDFISDIIKDNKNYLYLLKDLMLKVSSLAKDIVWNESTTPKFMFYGIAGEEDSYLMLFLKLIGCDILYLSPMGNDINEYINNIEMYSYKIEEKKSNNNLSFEERSNSGRVISEYTTIGMEAKLELEKNIFNEETGFYKPWQFIDYDTRSVLINSTFEEISIYYRENASVRPGFKVSDNRVNIPNFFAVVTGIDSNKELFGDFLNMIFDKNENLVLNNIAIYNYPISYEEAITYQKCFNGYLKVTEADLNKHVASNRFKNYRKGLKTLFINKLNEILESSYMMQSNFSMRDKVEYVATIMTMPEEFFQLIDSFDYTDKVPKISIYRDNNQNISIRELYVITFLNAIGIDIIFYSGFGTYGIEQWLNKNFITYHRLEKIEYNFNLETAMNTYRKKGFFARLFGK